MNRSRPTATFTCRHCGREFVTRRSRDAKFCSLRCSGFAQTPRSPPTAGINLNPAHFWAAVKKTEGCWLWTGHRNVSGYGHIRVFGKMVLAHRHAWFLTHGSEPDGLMLHHCDTPACVNPSHLYVGNHKDNARDAKVRGRLRIPARARLTANQVIEIRKRRATGEALRRIADDYQTTPENIFAVASRRTWRHIEDSQCT